MDRVIGFFIFVVYRLLCLTLRFKEINKPLVLEESLRKRRALILAHWHGDEWMLFYPWGKRHMAIMTSHSRDGTKVGTFARLLGFRVFRGSSSRGGAAGLLGLMRAVKAGCTTSLAVDGPKGPLYEVKMGVIELARHTGIPVVPMVAQATRGWELARAWNKTMIPKPFSTVWICYGPPLYVEKENKFPEAVEQARLHLQSQLNGIKSFLKDNINQLA